MGKIRVILEVELFDTDSALKALGERLPAWSFCYDEEAEMLIGYGPGCELTDRQLMISIIEATQPFHMIYHPQTGFDAPGVRV